MSGMRPVLATRHDLEQWLRVMQPDDVQIALDDAVSLLQQPSHPQRSLHHHAVEIHAPIRGNPVSDVTAVLDRR